MPELPEVHTITNDLRKYLTNAVILDVDIEKKYDVYPSRSLFIERTVGARVRDARRIAKNILIELNNGYFLGFHLAMTGRLLFRLPKYEKDKWVKVVFTAEKNGLKNELRFSDMRTFGKTAIYEPDEILKLEQKYGPEPISKTLKPSVFLDNIRKRRTTIKNALLDQSIISGLGNIYATDTLFLAKVHPETKTGDINLETAEKILKSAKTVLNEGINNRGSTLPDRMYVDIFGNEGSHQDHFKIYMKDICPECKSRVIYKKVNGRGTYFCEICQILPEDSLENPIST